MARYRGPKNRIARKFGVNIFGRARNPLLHKPNPPGAHGAKRKKKSDYGLQLAEKQKLKAVYGMISERQLVNYYKKAVATKGNTAEHFARFLECRLDVVVWRLKFASTIFAAQQLVSHGHIRVNGKKVDRRSFMVKPGMVVSIKENSRNMKPIAEALASVREVPVYFTQDAAKLTGQLMEVPQVDQISWPLEINLPEVCDFLDHVA